MGKFGEIFGKFLQQSPFPVGLLGLLTFIGTKGALRRPMTYDDHPIHPSHPIIALKTTSHELRLTNIVEERNSRHGSGGFSPERGGDSRQCDLDPSPVNFLTKYILCYNRTNIYI